MRLRAGDSSIALARRPEQRQLVCDTNAPRRAQTRDCVPAGSGIVSGDNDRVVRGIVLPGRVGSRCNIVERVGVVSLVLPNFVESGINEAVVVASKLIIDGRYCRPLRRTCAGAAEPVPAGGNARYIEAPISRAWPSPLRYVSD
jgi:hypothetical protein